MDNGKVDWRGCFPACVTPFAKSGEIDERKFVDNLELLMREGATGLVIAGHSGESWALSPEEKARLFKLAVEVAGRRVPVVAGTGDICTPLVVDLSKKAKDVGCAGVMIMPPYYAGIARNAVVAHYRAVSDEARIPIMLYNHPPSTGIDLDASFLEELVEIEYVVATKESTADIVQIATMLDRVGGRMRIFAGHSARVGLAAVTLGCPGFVGSMEPQIMGREGFDLFRLADERRIDEARRVNFRTLRCSVEVGAIGSFPANLKAAMNMLGRPGGWCRKPVLELTPAEAEKVQGVLDGLGLFTAAGARAAE
jgi:4-hydroxy-tetrahydrodipicolinate synthase